MPSGDPPHLTERLRFALAIGRQQRAEWPRFADLLAASRDERCDATPPLLEIGVISAPGNVWRRRRIRHARDLMLSVAERCAVVVTFVLGQPAMFAPAERQTMEYERQRHNDLVLLPAHDGSTASDETHGGRAVAEKSLGWFVHACNASAASFVAKIDDDTLVNLPRLVVELRALSTSAARPEYAYYGVHVYRLWDWAHQAETPDGACGKHAEVGPPNRRASATLLSRLRAELQPRGKCTVGG